MRSSNLKKFSSKLSTLTSLLDVSQAEIARRIGMQPSHLNLFLKGRGDLHSQRLIDLLKEIGIDLESQIDDVIARLADKDSAESHSDFEQMIRQLHRVPRAERESLSLIISRLSTEKNAKSQKRRGLQ